MAHFAGVPRWVKALVLVTAVLLLLVALVMVTGVGGEHGPSRHLGQRRGSETSGMSLVDPVAAQ